ncbi:CRISPR-associated protein (Cas_Cas02710) [Pseudomonas pohangensis]|uniref:CRISPR-associated protein (Cas_Cas02710) n=1 Tax=Pseudomonas pohangensis TaxID=364197 RepID=A0A1H2G1L5_9PSED|nr:hypothetical protein [Pseudomonas pohangensis]SDU13492.1 CRISPR-associated protein (Cas_Cas02710) [Pseudomonas pohangensis]
MKRFFNNLATAFGALLAVIVAGWVTDGLNGTPILLFSSFLPDYEILKAAGLGVLLLAGSTLALYHYQRPKIGQVMEPQLVDNPRNVLIAMLSQWADQKEGNAVAGVGVKLPAIADLDGQSEAQILAAFAGASRWNGIPLLHGLLAHRQKLERCYLLVTDGVGGSAERFAYVRDLVKLLMPGVQVISTSIKAADLNNLFKYYETIRVLEGQIKKDGYSEHDVMIDSTGGPKLYSMAAAYATLHNEYALQYVKFEGQNPSVLEFSYEVKPVKTDS